MNFSQRIGLEPATRPFQKDSMDAALRTGLWNAFEMFIQPALEAEWLYPVGPSREGANGALFVPLWISFFKFPLASLPPHGPVALERVTQWFFDDKHVPWNKVYEFVEFVANSKGDLEKAAQGFVRACNSILARECSAYRFVGKTLAPITSEDEIKAIERAESLEGDLLRPLSMHIEQAVKLLSDRKLPDYRNSMKESISAVETVCKIIAQNPTTTLGPALDAVLTRLGLHPKLHQGFKAIYGYTSDTHGIRHGLKDDAEPEAEDATFMLVSCSAFVNYLVEKARKKGLLPV